MKYFVNLQILRLLTIIRELWICGCVLNLLQYLLKVNILHLRGFADQKGLGTPGIDCGGVDDLVIFWEMC